MQNMTSTRRKGWEGEVIGAGPSDHIRWQKKQYTDQRPKYHGANANGWTGHLCPDCKKSNNNNNNKHNNSRNNKHTRPSNQSVNRNSQQQRHRQQHQPQQANNNKSAMNTEPGPRNQQPGKHTTRLVQSDGGSFKGRRTRRGGRKARFFRELRAWENNGRLGPRPQYPQSEDSASSKCSVPVVAEAAACGFTSPSTEMTPPTTEVEPKQKVKDWIKQQQPVQQISNSSTSNNNSNHPAHTQKPSSGGSEDGARNNITKRRRDKDLREWANVLETQNRMMNETNHQLASQKNKVELENAELKRQLAQMQEQATLHQGALAKALQDAEDLRERNQALTERVKATLEVPAPKPDPPLAVLLLENMVSHLHSLELVNSLNPAAAIKELEEIEERLRPLCLISPTAPQKVQLERMFSPPQMKDVATDTIVQSVNSDPLNNPEVSQKEDSTSQKLTPKAVMEEIRVVQRCSAPCCVANRKLKSELIKDQGTDPEPMPVFVDSAVGTGDISNAEVQCNPETSEIAVQTGHGDCTLPDEICELRKKFHNWIYSRTAGLPKNATYMKAMNGYIRQFLQKHGVEDPAEELVDCLLHEAIERAQPNDIELQLASMVERPDVRHQMHRFNSAVQGQMTIFQEDKRKDFCKTRMNKSFLRWQRIADLFTGKYTRRYTKDYQQGYEPGFGKFKEPMTVASGN
ncbi:hypothetical protein 2 [Hubei tombus-like virus 14]|uniref:hypothetical protein 2 n=1 Tax=Hubei tombus-like virus 14 TaxID=1923260 RepID=UPI00090A4382|nr:hypothetical protein 2 [Hubei tombus-like virus 14]APG76382.1 hypothetical protein 2 [Hubei tombus-like virus 14]